MIDNPAQRFSKRVEVEGDQIEVHVELNLITLKTWDWRGFSRKVAIAGGAPTFELAKAEALKWLIEQIQKREEGWTKTRLEVTKEALS